MRFISSPSVFNRRKHRDDTGTFKLFVTDRTKPFAVDSIRRLLKDPLGSVVVDDIELDRRIDPAFEANRLANRTQEPLANAENPVAAVLLSADDTNDLLQDQSATPVIELVNRILFDAVQQQASDIHFQPVEKATRRSHSTLLRDDAVAKGMQLLSKAGEIKIREGVTTREEVERVTMRASM